MSKQYKYDAFISYRHTDLDKFVAEKIHKYLEEFKLPKSVLKEHKLEKSRIARVFRDKEELTIANNLEDPIIQALQSSEYLIVICSPRTKESEWCRKEVEKFIEFHGRSKILTVLIEGEPQESFPEELLFEEEVVRENGIDSIHRRNIEPLAADIRANSKSKMVKLIKTELLRVIAPIFGLEYDDLRQRHRERRIKKIVTASIAAASICLIVGVAGVASALIINNQKDEIEKQKDEITTQKEQIQSQNDKLLLHQAESLADEALENLAQDRRIDAINKALTSVTSYEGMKMPYTASGRYALTQALRVYDIGNVNKAQSQLMTDANISGIELSPSMKSVLALDKARIVYVWDVATGNLKIKIDDLAADVYYDNDISFVGDNMLAYRNYDNKVVIVNMDNYEERVVSDTDGAMIIKGDNSGQYLAVNDYDTIKVYDANNGDIICQVEPSAGKVINSKLVWCGNKVMYIEEARDGEDGSKSSSRNIKIVDVISKKTTLTDVDFNSVYEAKMAGGCIYINGGNYGSLEAGQYAMALAIDENSGEIVWQKKYDGKVIKKIDIIEENGKAYVMLALYNEIACLEGDTGNVYFSDTITEGIADFAIGTGGYGQILDIKGNLVAFNVFEKEMYGMEYYLECNVSNIDNLKISADGFLVLPKASNYLIKYECIDNKDKEAYVLDEALKEEMEDLWYPSDDAIKEAEKIGVTNPELAASVLYIDDNTAIIAYLDFSLEIYDIGNKTVISSVQEIKGIPTKYFGADNEGNIYIAGDMYGYCFDKDYNLIAEIGSLMHADINEGYLVIGDIAGDMWKFPIYSLEDLIEKAEEYNK